MKIYKYSAPGAGVLPVADDGRVLLAIRKFDPFKGKYDIIGGFLKYGEDPVTGVIREAKEESGLAIKILELLGVYTDTYGPSGESTLNFYYVGKIISGKPKANDDVASLKWVSIDKLPKPAFKSQEPAFKNLQKWYLGRGGRN